MKIVPWEKGIYNTKCATIATDLTVMFLYFSVELAELM